MEIEFTESAIAYLEARKDGPIDELCFGQILRARKQLAWIANYLRPVRTVLDIGCGLALVDVYLAREFGVKTIHLMDGDGTGEFHTEYRQHSEPWNDVAMAAEMVRLNVPASVEVHAHYINLDLMVEVDLLISLKSWGLHYPAETYMELAKRCLQRDGFLVIDLHHPDEGKELFAFNGFQLVASNESTGRGLLPFERCIFKCA